MHAITKTLRPGDKAYRIGGDEIVVIRYDAPEDLSELDNRMRDAVANEPEIAALELPDELYTGISLGSRRFSAGDTADTWFAQADAILKQDKQAFNATIPREVIAQDSRIV